MDRLLANNRLCSVHCVLSTIHLTSPRVILRDPYKQRHESQIQFDVVTAVRQQQNISSHLISRNQMSCGDGNPSICRYSSSHYSAFLLSTVLQVVSFEITAYLCVDNSGSHKICCCLVLSTNSQLHGSSCLLAI